MKSLTCSVIEGASYDLDEIVDRCAASRDIIVSAFRSLREALESYARSFPSISRRLIGASIRIDTPMPRILRIGGKLRIYTGLWSGVFGYRIDDTTLTIAIVPRVRNYDVMIQVVENTLGSVARDFQVLLNAVPASAVGYALNPAISRILTEVLELCRREPRRFVDRVDSDVGIELLVETAASGVYVRTSDLVYRINTGLLNAIALTLRSIAISICRIQALIDILKDYEDRNFIDPVTRAVRMAIDRLRAQLSIVLSEEVVQLALTRQPLESSIDIGKYDYLLSAARKVENGMIFESTSSEQAWFFLYPSTKLYELYVYACIADAFMHITRSRPRYRSKLTITLPETVLYFNRYPAKLSRIVAKLCKRVPKPDIVVKRRGHVIVVDAKYRFLDTTRPRTLGLGDAERIAAYILDVCRDSDFLAFVAALSKPPESDVESALDGKNVRVKFVELNPDREDTWNRLGKLLESVDASWIRTVT